MTIKELKNYIPSEYKKIEKLGNNRYKVQYEEYAQYYLHSTPLVTHFYSDNRIVLDSGEYYTVTTKKAMNEFLEACGSTAYISQKNFEWFVTIKGVSSAFHNLFTFKI